MQRLGARVFGYALPASESRPSMHTDGVRPDEECLADIRDFSVLSDRIQRFSPDVIFHLAAQALVIPSYEDPIGTISTNVTGTANVLSAAHRNDVRVVVNVTSDKCYTNNEWDWPYRETDGLGGKDIYSASKACSEILSDAYRSSFYTSKGLKLITVRAGNVIGGGDWAPYRLIPDIVTALLNDQPIVLRNPQAVRPWQHVLDPLRAYVQIAELACAGQDVASSWNIGPNSSREITVAQVVDLMAEHLGKSLRVQVEQLPYGEASRLRLDTSRIRANLGWAPLFDVNQALALTAQWYSRHRAGDAARTLCDQQISAMFDLEGRQH